MHILIKIFLLSGLIFFIAVPGAMAQPQGAVVKKINGKEFYLHTVKRGETVSGISKAYKVSVSAVLNENPDSGDKIKPGDVLKIPVTDKNRPSANTQTITPPDDQVRTTTTAGDKTHTVERGETVYGIARKYGVTQEEILKLNPDAANGISPGDVLVITRGANTSASGGKKVAIDYLVKPSETFFSISRKFNISVDSVKSLNGGLPEGLKAGSTIHLFTSEQRAAELKDEVTRVQTNTNNNGNNTTEPVVVPIDRENEIVNKDFKSGKKDVYHVGLVLPFFFDKNEKYMLENDNRNRAQMYEPTRQSMDFYHGVRLAMDSLKKSGLNVVLHVFDSVRDSVKVREICQKPEFKTLDLLIGPTEHLELVGRYAKANQLPVVCPVAYSNRILLDNPYLFKMIGSASVMADYASKYIVKHYPDANVILIDTKGAGDKGIVRAYIKYLNRYRLKETTHKDSVRVLKMDYFKAESLKPYLSYEKKNIIIIPSSDFAYVSVSLSNLNKFMVHAKNMHKEYDISVFGTEEWIKMDDIDIGHKLRTQVHVPAPTFVDYDTLQTRMLVKSFRQAFHTDPDKYALMGFDIAYFWLAGYLEHGLDFNAMITRYEMDLTQTGMRFFKLNENSGYLNLNVYILKYENFKLIPQQP